MKFNNLFPQGVLGRNNANNYMVVQLDLHINTWVTDPEVIFVASFVLVPLSAPHTAYIYAIKHVLQS